MSKIAYRQGLVGGSGEVLDAIPELQISDGDSAMVIDTDIFYFYRYDAARSDAESSPDIIRPDDFSGSGVWILSASPYVPPTATVSPVGTVIMWPTDTAPTGFLMCKGQDVDRVGAYASLFAAIGTMYGDGDGSTTFTLPDYRGTFLRGVDDGAGVDPNAETRTDRGDGTTGDFVGTEQPASGINNRVNAGTTITITDNDGTTSGGNVEYAVALNTAPISSTIINVKPRNTGIMFCIKY